MIFDANISWFRHFFNTVGVHALGEQNICGINQDSHPSPLGVRHRNCLQQMPSHLQPHSTQIQRSHYVLNPGLWRRCWARWSAKAGQHQWLLLSRNYPIRERGWEGETQHMWTWNKSMLCTSHACCATCRPQPCTMNHESLILPV